MRICAIALLTNQNIDTVDLPGFSSGSWRSSSSNMNVANSALTELQWQYEEEIFRRLHDEIATLPTILQYLGNSF